MGGFREVWNCLARFGIVCMRFGMVLGSFGMI